MRERSRNRRRYALSCALSLIVHGLAFALFVLLSVDVLSASDEIVPPGDVLLVRSESAPVSLPSAAGVPTRRSPLSVAAPATLVRVATTAPVSATVPPTPDRPPSPLPAQVKPAAAARSGTLMLHPEVPQRLRPGSPHEAQLGTPAQARELAHIVSDAPLRGMPAPPVPRPRRPPAVPVTRAEPAPPIPSALPSADEPKETVVLTPSTLDSPAAPSPVPSSAPTPEPTSVPILAAAAASTPLTVVTPERAPTTAPTIAPTRAPTAAPAATPRAPAALPAEGRPAAPSAEPDLTPTQAPTVAPTQAPTVAPTRAPTIAPTQAPTVAPTQAPTVAPTRAPTIAPAQAPTVAPTFAPPRSPTAPPTQVPAPVPSLAQATPVAAPAPVSTARATRAPLPATTPAANRGSPPGAPVLLARAAPSGNRALSPAHAGSGGGPGSGAIRGSSSPAAAKASGGSPDHVGFTPTTGASGANSGGLGSLNAKLKSLDTGTDVDYRPKRVAIGDAQAVLDNAVLAYEARLAPPPDILRRTFGFIYARRSATHEDSLAYVYDTYSIGPITICKAWKITEHPYEPVPETGSVARSAGIGGAVATSANSPNVRRDAGGEAQVETVQFPCTEKSYTPVPRGSLTTPLPRHPDLPSRPQAAAPPSPVAAPSLAP